MDIDLTKLPEIVDVAQSQLYNGLRSLIDSDSAVLEAADDGTSEGAFLITKYNDKEDAIDPIQIAGPYNLCAEEQPTDYIENQEELGDGYEPEGATTNVWVAKMKSGDQPYIYTVTPKETTRDAAPQGFILPVGTRYVHELNNDLLGKIKTSAGVV